MQLLAQTDLQLLAEEEINEVAGGLIYDDIGYDPITGEVRAKNLWGDTKPLLL